MEIAMRAVACNIKAARETYYFILLITYDTKGARARVP